MFLESDMKMEVAIPIERLGINEVVPYSCIVSCALKNLFHLRPSKEKGYCIAVKKVNRIGNGIIKKDDQCNIIIISVELFCQTFLPTVGETMVGIVHHVNFQRVWLKSGPIKHIVIRRAQLSHEYIYLASSNEFASSCDDMSKTLKMDIVVRFMVIGKGWLGSLPRPIGEFLILAGLEDIDGLGPASLEVDDELAWYDCLTILATR